MIKFLQERVNKTTKDYEGMPVAVRDTDDAKSDARELSKKQARVEGLTRKLASKLNHENDVEEGK
jgi:hypothetical protein